MKFGRNDGGDKSNAQKKKLSPYRAGGRGRVGRIKYHILDPADKALIRRSIFIRNIHQYFFG
jgi:hypothetical protein